MLKVENLIVNLDANFKLAASFSVENHSWVSIIGSSGSGKTTLVQALSGFTRADEGTITKNGIEITNMHPSARDFAIVFQRDTLFSHLTVEENLLLAMHDSKLRRADKMDQIASLIQGMQLPKSFLSKHPRELSGGQRARVSVARSLARGSSWLILDEAFSSLDENLRLEIHFWLEKIHLEKGITILSVTHQQNEARLFSDQMIVMKNGSIIFDGPPCKLDQSLVMTDRQASATSEFILAGHSQIQCDSNVMALQHDEFEFIFDDEVNKAQSTQFIPLKNSLVLDLGSHLVVRDQGSQTLLHVGNSARRLLEEKPIGIIIAPERF